MVQQTVSDLTLKRLPVYLHYLKDLREKGIDSVSASQLGKDLSVHHTQVRKDLAATGLRGVPKVGHRVMDVIRAIEDFLNWNNTTDAFLVGVGNLGSSLAGFAGMQKTGIQIVAAFDNDPAKIGKKAFGVEVLPIEKLAALIRRMKVHIGIICTPASVSQEIADIMAENGILAIWNFAPVNLQVPDDIIVENVDILRSLSVLSRRLKEKIAEID